MLPKLRLKDKVRSRTNGHRSCFQAVGKMSESDVWSETMKCLLEKHVTCVDRGIN